MKQYSIALLALGALDCLLGSGAASNSASVYDAPLKTDNSRFIANTSPEFDAKNGIALDVSEPGEEFPTFRSGRDIPAVFAFSNDAYLNEVARHERAKKLSNDANLDMAVFVEPLETFVSKIVEDEGMLEELNALAPPVPTGRQFAYHQSDQLQDFQKDDASNRDVRQIGGEFQELTQSGTRQLGETICKGLRIKLDHDQGGKDPSVRQTWVKNLTDRLIRSDISRTVTIMNGFTASTYSSGTINWGKSNTTADPDNDLMQLLLESGDDRGIDSNVISMAGTLWARRWSALANTVNPALTTTRTLKPDQLAEILMVDKIHVSSRRYQYSVTNSTGAQSKKQLLGTNLFIYYALEGATPMDPSNIKRFTTTAEGVPFKVFVEERNMYTIISVCHYSTIIQTSTLGARKCAITFT